MKLELFFKIKKKKNDRIIEMSYKREMKEEGVRKHELKVGLWDCKRYDFFPYTHMRLLLILQVDSPHSPTYVIFLC